MRRQVSLLLRGGGEAECARLGRLEAQLRFLCKLERIDTLAGEPPAAAPAVVGELQLFVPLEGLVDLDAERVRLDKDIARVAAVIEQERARLAEWSAKLDALTTQRTRLD